MLYVFDAQLLNLSGVSATVAVAGHEHLTVLHDAIQQAFNWENDHLYSFWLDGQFWGDAAAERVIPGARTRTARPRRCPSTTSASGMGRRRVRLRLRR